MFLFLNMGGGEIILILFFVLIFFGSAKIPDLAKGLGKGIREFKDAANGIQREIEKSANEVREEVQKNTTLDQISEEEIISPDKFANKGSVN